MTAGRFAALLVAGALVFPSAVAAQIVRGNVLDRATGAPVGAGFVVLVDSAGNEVTRGLSNARGAFSIRAPVAGTYVLRSERIGYRVSESGPIEIGQGVTRFTLNVDAVPVRLATIEVTGSQSCRISRSEGATVGIVWEELRKSLAAARWTADRERYSYVLGLTERQLDRNAMRVLDQSTRVQNLTSAAPFRASSPESLADSGYMRRLDNGDALYYAPDADVFLHPTFQQGHCLRVVRDDDRVGIEFEPVPDQRLPDVAGKLWMDEETAVLRNIEFWYTGLGEITTQRAARGEINFMQVGEGEYVVGDWSIRLPELRRRGDARRFRPRIDGYHDTVGEVLEVRNIAGETVYEAAPAVLNGVVFDSTSNAPMPGATVSLVGVRSTTVTDSLGAFTLGGPFRGQYGLAVMHPWLDSVGYAIGTLVDFGSGDTVNVRLTIPHVNVIQEALCAGADLSAVAPGEGAGLANTRTLLGQVMGPGASAGRRVVARWNVESNLGIAGMSQRAAEAVATSDDEGRYVACGLPVDMEILVHAEDGDSLSSPVRTIRFRSGEEAAIVVDGMSHSADRPIWREDFRLGNATSAPVALTGVITDATTGRPLAGATVSIWGTDISVNTNAGGGFSIPDPPTGPQQIFMRKVGYRPSIYSVELPEGRGLTVPPAVSALRPNAVRLASIDVEAEGAPYLTGFRQRRALGLGHFITRAEFEVYRPVEPADLVRRVPGLRVVPNPRYGTLLPDSSGVMDARRNLIQNGRRQSDCIIFYFVDGIRRGRSDVDPLDLIVNLDDVQAVEFYRSSAQTPAQYSVAGGGCGAILFWTR